MKFASASVLGLVLMTAAPAAAQNGAPINRSADPITLAVFGDWPYSADLLNAAPLLVDSVNSDPKVKLVVHVGDIHSGSMPCTGKVPTGKALPVGAQPDPNWDLTILDIFEQFKDPVIYTPGDNEWTDCHKTKEFKSGHPMAELAYVRDLFFPTAGLSLGGRPKQVVSQAQWYDPAHPEDAAFVENVMWEQSRVLFVTLNMPGSNNDGLTWTNGFEAMVPGARDAERTARTAADIRWLNAAFNQAKADSVDAVVIALQADMWDPEAAAPGGDGLSGYTSFVQALASNALDFGKPVLLLNGDSHLYETDRPLADPSSVQGRIHNTPAVPNLTRITVQGSTNLPREWLRLTIDPRAADVFSYDVVTY